MCTLPGLNYAMAIRLDYNNLLMINLANGDMVKSWDLGFLKEGQETDVVNGIIYLPSRDSFLVTGKQFHNIFELKFNYRNFFM